MHPQTKAERRSVQPHTTPQTKAETVPEYECEHGDPQPHSSQSEGDMPSPKEDQSERLHAQHTHHSGITMTCSRSSSEDSVPIDIQSSHRSKGDPHIYGKPIADTIALCLEHGTSDEKLSTSELRHRVTQPSSIDYVAMSANEDQKSFCWGKKHKRKASSDETTQWPIGQLHLDVHGDELETHASSSNPSQLLWGTKRKCRMRRTKPGAIRLNTINRFLHSEYQHEQICTGDGEGGPSDNDGLTQGEVDGNQVCLTRRHANNLMMAFVDEDSDSDYDVEREVSHRRKKSILPVGDKAISKSGYTCRGRVKQKAQKRVELIKVGSLRLAKGWYNAGYIFPLGFKSKTMFRSSIDLDEICIHECEIVKGMYWPAPTFMITVQDRPEEPLSAKSSTGCWSLVLQRINQEINRRRRLGEILPPPPRTAIPGPEYFGLNQDDILRKIESLDAEKKCDLYWTGKIQLKRAIHSADQKSRLTVGGTKSSRQRKYISESEEEDQNGDEEGVEHASNAWSTIGRLDRYRRRCRERGGESELEEDDNPLPHFIDPITMQPVVTPAISPYGHVVGLATWRACLSDQRICPFTRHPLTVEQCTVLTKHNIEKYKDKIVHQ